MKDDSIDVTRSRSEALDHWSARKHHPAVVLYVVAVFAAFIALAHFVFHSLEAVKALAVAAVGAVVATAPVVLEKVEYRLTATAVERRPLNPKRPRQFKAVFQWHELDRVVPLKRGFKYFKKTGSEGLPRRFWQLYLSDTYSGEVHVEKDDLARILAIVEQRRG
jgi:hypothetical protein